MKARLTLVVEVLEPALVTSTEDLVALDATQIRQVSLRLTPTSGDVLGVEAKAESETTNLVELVAFARAVQTEPTTIEIWFRGRFEAFEL